MNSNEIKDNIQNEINTIVENNRNQYRRQYDIAKWAREQLQSLGLWEYIENCPRKVGQIDATNIIASATGETFSAADRPHADMLSIQRMLQKLDIAEREAEEDAAAEQARSENRSTFDARYQVTLRRYESECEAIRERLHRGEIDNAKYTELTERAYVMWQKDVDRALKNDPLRAMRRNAQ